MASSVDGGMDQLIQEMEFLANNEVRIGVLAGGADSDSQSQRSKTGDVKADDQKEVVGPGGVRTRSTLRQIDVFAVHELGLGIDKRSSLGWVMDHERTAIEEIASRVTRGVMDGILTGQQALGLMGEAIIALIQRRIRERIPPPLSDETIEAKTRADGKTADIPLVHLGQYIRSFRWNVVGSQSGR